MAKWRSVGLRVSRTENDDSLRYAAFRGVTVVPSKLLLGYYGGPCKEGSMDDNKTNSTPEKIPVRVIQLEDGYVEIFSETHIAFGSGKAPWPVKES